MDQKELMQLLEEAQNAPVSYVDLKMATQRIKVDMDTRKITGHKEFGVIKDHLAENIIFEVKRYKGDTDLAEKHCAIHWENGKNGGVVPVTEVDLSEDGFILMRWELSDEFTQYKGQIAYALHFFSILDGGFTYHAATNAAVGTLGTTLNASAHSKNKITPSEIEVYIAKMNELSASMDAQVVLAQEAATKAESIAEQLAEKIAKVEELTQKTEINKNDISKLSGDIAELKSDLVNKIENGGGLVYDKTFTLSQGSAVLDEYAVQDIFIRDDILKVVVSCSDDYGKILDIQSYVIYADGSATPWLEFSNSSQTIFTAKKDIKRIALRAGNYNTYTGDINVKIYKTSFRQILSDYTSNNGIVIEKHVPKLKKDNYYLLTLKGGSYYLKLSNYNRNDKCIIALLDCVKNTIYKITSNSNEGEYFFELTDEQCEQIQYIYIGFWTDSDSLDFSLKYGVNAVVSNYEITSKKNKNLYLQRLIGAVFFDGWRGKWDNSTYSTKSQSLYEQSSIYDSSYPDWRDKYNSIYGHYPTQQMSFSISFPEEVAKLTNSNGENYPNLPSRKPLNDYNGVSLGWVNTATQEQIEAQIDMAYKYGIDYWAIVTGFSPKYFVNGEFQEEEWFKNNPSIRAIMNASNKYKIRFCLINTFSPKSETGVENVLMRKFLEEKIMSDSQYLYIDGKPVLIEYVCDGNSATDGIFESYCHLRNISIISSGYRGFGIDGVTSYAGYAEYISSETYLQKEYKVLSEYNLGNTKKHFDETKGTIILPVSTGRAMSARSDFTVHNADYKSPTKEELKRAITEMIDYFESLNTNDKVIMIYAWNEFCEGGWLMPTQNEIDSGDGFYKLEALKEAKDYWKSLVN